MPEHTAAPRLRLPALCFLLQALNILLFAVFVRYSPESSPGRCPPQLNCSQRSQDPPVQQPPFHDVPTQVLLSFGLLLAFLSRYGPASAAVSILIIALAIQWAVLIQGFLNSFLDGKISLGAESLVSADLCAAAVLISTGALLGRLNPVQTLLLALLEVTLCSLTQHILLSLMGVKDAGGSLTVHTFGAYFGLAASRLLYRPQEEQRRRAERQDTGQREELLAVLGTIYLWIFWPSFASRTDVQGSASSWAALNAYFTLVASVLATFILSPVLQEESTPRMVHLQGATLAGVAVMGTAGEMLLTPFGALSAGFLVGLISQLGCRFFTPALHSRLKIQDACGVHNVHGLPGVLGALLGTLLTLLATADTFGDRLELVFPLVAQGSRTVTDQAFIQLGALPLTLLLAALGGCITGAVLKTKVVLRCSSEARCTGNAVLWEVAEEGGEPRAGGKELGTSTLV